MDLLLKRLTEARNDSKEHIMAGTLKGGCARADMSSVRMLPRICIVREMGV